MDQLELGDSAGQQRVNLACLVQPIDQLLRHHYRHAIRRRWRVRDRSSVRIHDVGLNGPEFPRCGTATANTLYETIAWETVKRGSKLIDESPPEHRSCR